MPRIRPVHNLHSVGNVAGEAPAPAPDTAVRSTADGPPRRLERHASLVVDGETPVPADGRGREATNPRCGGTERCGEAVTGALETADTRVNLAPAVASHHGETASASAVRAGAGAGSTDALARGTAVEQPVDAVHVHPGFCCGGAVGEEVPSERLAGHDSVQPCNAHYDRALDVFWPQDVLSSQGKKRRCGFMDADARGASERGWDGMGWGQETDSERIDLSAS